MAFQIDKTDPELGKKVHEHLVAMGMETPTTDKLKLLSDSEKVAAITEKMREVWETLGMDLSDDSLIETPKRIAKMMVYENYWGLHPENFPKCTTIENKFKVDEMIVVKDITLLSQCEHHGVVIDGMAHIAYIPNKRVLGLSKFSRVASYFAARPQVQERLTSQIYYALAYVLDTQDVAVSIDAVHYCVKSRGVTDQSSRTVTTHLGGCFKDEHKVRAEFMKVIK